MLAFPTTPRLPPSSTVLLALLLAYLPLSSIRRPYITFKLPCSNIDTPQRLRNLFRFPVTGMCHFLLVHHLEWHFWPGQKVKTLHSLDTFCCGFQIRPVEEQLKQRVIGERYCINRKRKSYKRSTSHSRLAVCQMSRKKREVVFSERAKIGEYVLIGRVHLWGMIGYVPITLLKTHLV